MQRVYLVRHGEVDNPGGVIYGRLPGFGLTPRGHDMAAAAADDLRELLDATPAQDADAVTDVPRAQDAAPGAIAAETAGATAARRPLLVASPLQRTRESAAPIATAFGINPVIDERVIEPWNAFEGTRPPSRSGAWRNPVNWPYFARPWQPSWGEPYREIVTRMRAAILAHTRAARGADVMIVTHQLPIWLVHRALAHEPLAHHPGRRRCALSSITVLEYRPSVGFTEVDYREPAARILNSAVNQGAA